MRSSLRAGIRLLLYIGVTLALMPVQILAVRLKSPLSVGLPVFFHRLCCRILGFTVEVAGTRSPDTPALFVSNHVSYLDITVLGSLIRGSFIAKAEVGDWPMFGLLARLQRTVFVDRRSIRAAAQRDELATRLEAGDSLILFPEGTSDDGTTVLPFKSALFAVTETALAGKRLTVQPLSIAYTALDGMPLGRAFRPRYAWYGDMTLLPHLWEMLGFGTVTVSVTFHEAVDPGAFASRKTLAEYCHRVVAGGVEAAISGRKRAAPAPAFAHS